jgi:hypothetical protein
MKKVSELSDRELAELNLAASMLIISDLTHIKNNLIKGADSLNIVSDNKENMKIITDLLKSIS